LVRNERSRARSKYPVNARAAVWQVERVANFWWHPPDEPDNVRLHLLLCRQVAFDEDLKSVANYLRIFVAKRADALLKLCEGTKVLVNALPYKLFRVGVF
jgi:hypothetical protein